MLTSSDHSRDSAGMKYVYPVVSRRAGGVSIGINLNVNNACNWRCRYCQVPSLIRGVPPQVDSAHLEDELRRILDAICYGDFLVRNVPPEARRLMDIAFSGNGEPTSSAQFSEVVEIVGKVFLDYGLKGRALLRLITNGSFLHRAGVRRGIARIRELDGEVWFKVDCATTAGMERINGVALSIEKVWTSIETCADLAPTWIQTSCFAIDGRFLSMSEQVAYLEFVRSLTGKIKGVLLYGLARPSHQPGAERLSNLTPQDFTQFAGRIESLGVKVVANP